MNISIQTQVRFQCFLNAVVEDDCPILIGKVFHSLDAVIIMIALIHTHLEYFFIHVPSADLSNERTIVPIKIRSYWIMKQISVLSCTPTQWAKFLRNFDFKKSCGWFLLCELSQGFWISSFFLWKIFSKFQPQEILGFKNETRVSSNETQVPSSCERGQFWNLNFGLTWWMNSVFTLCIISSGESLRSLRGTKLKSQDWILCFSWCGHAELGSCLE